MKTDEINTNSLYLLLIIPVVSAILALCHFGFFFKSGSCGAGILILLLLYFRQLSKATDIVFLMSAFLFSIIGDWFLSNKNGSSSMFIYGIAFYLFAHLGYWFYSIQNGRIRWSFTLVLLGVFLVFFGTVLYPSIGSNTLRVSVLGYLIISCISLGAAVGLKSTGIEKWTYIVGIFLILLSDTIIALNEFVGFKEFNFLILPTYYLAHFSILLSLIRRKVLELAIINRNSFLST
nr:lysoplasmalogenase [uncultured Draconibacterium sp.]